MYTHGAITYTNYMPMYDASILCYFYKDDEEFGSVNGSVFIESEKDFTVYIRHGSSTQAYYGGVTLNAIKLG